MCGVCGGEGCLVDGQKQNDLNEQPRPSQEQALARVIQLLPDVCDLTLIDAVSDLLHNGDADGALRLLSE